MVKGRRSYKVAEQVRGVIAKHVLSMADSRFFLVTITSVVLSSDLREAKVYWNVSGSKDRIQDTQQAFDSAVGTFRNAVGKSLDLRRVPELRFYYDDTLDTVEEVERLLEKNQIGKAS